MLFILSELFLLVFVPLEGLSECFVHHLFVSTLVLSFILDLELFSLLGVLSAAASSQLLALVVNLDVLSGCCLGAQIVIDLVFVLLFFFPFDAPVLFVSFFDALLG